MSAISAATAISHHRTARNGAVFKEPEVIKARLEWICAHLIVPPFPRARRASA
jgi:hypothetical protein